MTPHLQAGFALLAAVTLAGCGGSGTPRAYQPLDLPPDLALYELTEAQQRTFCAWMYDPDRQCGADPSEAVTDPALVSACMSNWASYPICTVSQYDACGRAMFADPCGSTPDACKAISECPVIPPSQGGGGTPSNTCDGVMAPGSVRWCDVDGTAKDMTTGNVWLKNVDCGDTLGIPLPYPYYAIYRLADSFRWASLLSTNHCSLLDASVAGDWVLPNRGQFLSLVNGIEPVSNVTPRLFTGTVPVGWDYTYWTGEPVDTTPSGITTWGVGTLSANVSWYGTCKVDFASSYAHHLPVRQTLVVTSLASIKAGQGYSLAPASKLNPVTGTSYFTRSYLTADIAQFDYPPGYVSLSSWDNTVRISRLWYFEADPTNPGYFRITYQAAEATLGVWRYLQVVGASTRAGADVAGLYGVHDGGGDERRWKPEFVDGGWMLKNKNSGLCIEVQAPAAGTGSVLVQNTCDPTNSAQAFVMTPRG